ncbi:MAG: T9SS type A sorting domain-containing protein [Hyphomicrobiales bacterium]
MKLFLRRISLVFLCLFISFNLFSQSVKPLPPTIYWYDMWRSTDSYLGKFSYVRDDVKFISGNFTGDGNEEVLCLGTTKSRAHAHLIRFKYEDRSWESFWSQECSYDEHMFGYYAYYEKDNIVVADFDNDGLDEILFYGKKTAMFEYTRGNFCMMYNDNGNPNKTWSYFSKRMFAGDFYGKDKDVLVGFANKGNYVIYTYENERFNIIYRSDYEDAKIMKHANVPMHVGDFNGDGLDDIVALGETAALYECRKGDFTPIWSNGGIFKTDQFPDKKTYFKNPNCKVFVANVDDDRIDELQFYVFSNLGLNRLQRTKQSFEFRDNRWRIDHKYHTNYGLLAQFTSHIAPVNYKKRDYILEVAYKGSGHYFNSYGIYTRGPIDNHEADIEIRTLTVDQVYPNPSKGAFTININNSELNANAKVNVTSLLGQNVFSQEYNNLNTGINQIKVNIPNIDNGLYLISVEADNRIHTEKIRIDK